MSFSPDVILLTCTILVLGSCLQSAAGFAFGMFAIPMLILIRIDPPQAIIMIVFCGTIQTIIGVYTLRQHIDWKQVGMLIAVSLVTTPLGAGALNSLLADFGSERVRQFFGGFILAALAVQWWLKVGHHDRLHWAWTLTAGALGGFFSGVAGMGGPPVVIWVYAHTWTNQKSRATLWAYFTGLMPIQVAAFSWKFGATDIFAALGTAALLSPVLVFGIVPGLWIGHRIPKPRLRQISYLIVLLVSLTAIFEPMVRSLFESDQSSTLSVPDQRILGNDLEKLVRAQESQRVNAPVQLLAVLPSTMIRPGDRVLITGASSGIGKELGRQLGVRKCRLALTGRRESKLIDACEQAREAGAEEVLRLIGSVTEIDVVREHYRQIAQQWGGIDCAILNAGVGDSENAREFSAGNYRWTMETNVFGVCNWLEVVIPGMIEAGGGLIVGISSPAGWCGLPQTGSYCASKAALSTLLESVRVDLRGTGVDVVIVCPGFVKSEITDRNDPKNMLMLLETGDGVRRMLRGIDKRTRVVHFPFPLTHFVRYGLGRMPRAWYDAIAARFIERNKRPYVDESDLHHRHTPTEPE